MGLVAAGFERAPFADRPHVEAGDMRVGELTSYEPSGGPPVIFQGQGHLLGRAAPFRSCIRAGLCS